MDTFLYQNYAADVAHTLKDMSSEHDLGLSH